MCIQNTKFLCMENTRNRIEKTKICWFTTIPSKITKILFVAHRPRIIKQYLRVHFSFLRQFTLKKLFATTNYVKICSPELFSQFLTHCVIEWHLQVFDTPRDPNKIISMHIEQAALQYFHKKVWTYKHSFLWKQSKFH